MKRFNADFLKNFLIFLLLLVFLIGWTLFVHKTGIDNLVEKVGVTNGYLLVALAGASGGLSGLTASGFLAVLISFAMGGLNPFLLGLIGGSALFLGDSFFYYLGRKGGEVARPFLKKWIKKFSDFIESKSLWMVRSFVFLYFSFAPLPNDIIVIPLGMAGYDFKKFFLFAWAGNIFFVFWVSLFFA
ncbi:MAG: VTT domain-containing protein [Patescibacteria group bacterium]